MDHDSSVVYGLRAFHTFQAFKKPPAVKKTPVMPIDCFRTFKLDTDKVTVVSELRAVEVHTMTFALCKHVWEITCLSL